MTITLYELAGSDSSRPFSPHCWKTVLSLSHKGLDYSGSPVPFTAIPEIEDGEGKSVPVIRDGDKVVRDSFDIAIYLDETYPDRPSLFGGQGGIAMARFFETWATTQILAVIGGALMLDIHAMLAPKDQDYFRQSREARFGRTLEEVVAAGRERVGSVSQKLEPMRMVLQRQPYLGGDGPLFCDYIVFGAFQWARTTSRARILEDGDPVADWFERCLDLHGGVGRAVKAAA